MRSEYSLDGHSPSSSPKISVMGPLQFSTRIVDFSTASTFLFRSSRKLHFWRMGFLRITADSHEIVIPNPFPLGTHSRGSPFRTHAGSLNEKFSPIPACLMDDGDRAIVNPTLALFAANSSPSSAPRDSPITAIWSPNTKSSLIICFTAQSISFRSTLTKCGGRSSIPNHLRAKTE